MKLENYYKKHQSKFAQEVEMPTEATTNFEQLIQQKLHSVKQQKIRFIKPLSIAASILVLISIGFWVQYQSEKNQSQNELLLAMNDDSAGKRLEGIYAFDEDYQQEDSRIINRLAALMLHDENANVQIASIDALLKFPQNQIVREKILQALEVEQKPLVQIRLIKAIQVLRDNRAQKPLKKIINNQETFPLVKNNATLAMASLQN